jgi:cytochrome b561
VSYPPLPRALHWITAILLLVLFGLGVSMTRWIPDDQKIRVYSWHEWAGLTVFAVTALRLLWRLTHRPPPLDIPAWEKVTANGVYVAMYLLLVAQPIVGWLLSAAFGFQVVYLGLIPVPVPVAEDKALAGRLQELHETLAIALALLFAAHLAGVLYHHLVRRDAVLSRMLPSAARRSGGSA